MATYGGDLSLQRFLALESRAVPFDAAHAIGNAGLALVAGPAMVRMLVRFRERFEWRAPAVASLLLLALFVAPPAPARAAPDLSAARAASWLVSQQNADGGWGASSDRDSAPEITAWAMLGLEAVGRSPLSVSRGGRTPVDYLRNHLDDLGSPGDYARTILALQGARIDPRSFGGRNLIAALLERRRDDGSYEGWPGSTAYAVIALREAGATGGLSQSISWLARAQNPDGGWGDLPKPPSTADGTAAAMQALPDTDVAWQGLGYLRRHQRDSGGFATGGNGAVNSQSTAWAVQGMIAVGADPDQATNGKSALEYLAARQDDDGHYRYSASSDQTPVWVTSQVLAAVAGEAYPVASVARPPKSEPPSPSATPGTDSSSTSPAGAGTARELLESFGAGGVPPSSAGGASPPTTPPATGPGAVPVPPPNATPEGDGVEPLQTAPPAAPRFEAGDDSGPEPWAPIGVGFAAAGLALAGVLLLGRRFSW